MLQQIIIMVFKNFYELLFQIFFYIPPTWDDNIAELPEVDFNHR